MKKLGLILLASVICVAWTLPAFAAEKKADPDKEVKKAEKPSEKKAPEKKLEEPKKEAIKAVEKKADKKEEASAIKQVTQGELAQVLVNVLGLSRFLPASPSPDQCFAILAANMVVPAEGWSAPKVVTKADLARVIVQAMKKQSEVNNPDDPKSWIDYLKSIGVPIDTVGEAVDNVGPVSDPVAPNVVTSSSDPLSKRHKFNPLDETQYGTDMAGLVRIISQLEFESGEFRPLPITQD